MISLPRVQIAHLPTPIEPLPNLTAVLKGPILFIKRDDQTGLAFGGNKTRKLEYLVAEAKAHGARTLITAGAGQSNHCRQTAAAAARFGFDCILVLYGEKPSSASANLLLDGLFGARIVWCQRSERDMVLDDTFNVAWELGQRPYRIPYGGSSPIGAAAYAMAVKEMLLQVKTSEGFTSPDWIVFASSSGGTQAGFVLGARLFGFTGKILGISIDERAEDLKHRVAKLAGDTADLLGEQIQFRTDDILVNDGYLGGGYGVFGQVEKEAIDLFARREGILLDPVYTGRAGAGLIDLIRKGYFKRDESVLFWHTGGTPAIFADIYQTQMAKS
jgi:D-cysteine desulfhydrase family pyridoxal phosphate-dependent enzyme